MRNAARRVLLVEGNPRERDLLSQRVERLGHSVDVASSGAELIDKINRAHYDLVLLDHMMPGTSSLDLLRMMGATHSEEALPVIMMTREASVEALMDALHAGAAAPMIGPTDPNGIVRPIEPPQRPDQLAFRFASCDPLTGLGDRALLLRRTQEAIERLQETDQVSVVVLDLDNFTAINDRFGTAAADGVLREVAARIGAMLPRLSPAVKAALFRPRDDEFAVLLEDMRRQDSVDLIGWALLREISRPIHVNGIETGLTASAGAARCLHPKITAQELLQQASDALRDAKDRGKSWLEIFDAAAAESARTRELLRQDLKYALSRGELDVFYQPIVNLETAQLGGFEALIRWRHPVRGMVTPAEFVPIAEDTGLIIDIGGWVLDQACRQLHAWQSRFPQSPPLSMNVNLSSEQLADPLLIGHVEDLLAETGIHPATLKLELTESAVIRKFDAGMSVLSRLREIGIGLALDDFGTGYSALSYLPNLSFDAIKIDRSFVIRLETDRGTRAIVEAIMGLARALNIRVVAEGIESEKQRTELLRLGCRAGQGYLFSRPLPADAAEQMLVEHALVSSRFRV